MIFVKKVMGLYFLLQVGRICWQNHSKDKENNAFFLYRGLSTRIIVIYRYILLDTV